MAFEEGNQAARKEVDAKVLDTLCATPPDILTNEDICEIMKLSIGVITRYIRENHDCTFGQYRVKKFSAIRQKLYRTQLYVALGDPDKKIKPNITMLIFMGKQYLNQYDRIEQKVTQTITTDETKLLEELSLEFQRLLANQRKRPEKVEVKEIPKTEGLLETKDANP